MHQLLSWTMSNASLVSEGIFIIIFLITLELFIYIDLYVLIAEFETAVLIHLIRMGNDIASMKEKQEAMGHEIIS